MNHDLSERDRVAQELCRLADSMERQESFKHRLLLGIAQGVGATIGATVLAGIVLSLLSILFQHTPLNMFFQQTPLSTP